jgi:alpha-amylase
MEHWTLPPGPALELEELERTLRDEGSAERAGRFVRGGHWRNFFGLYSESNRMHRKAQLLSELCRSRGDPPAARQAIGRAQCNDAYWHGVFGGLYLAHLRNAVWESLAEAEALLREGEALEVEALDVDADGAIDLWVHSSAFSCVVSPARGGAVLELTRLAERRNLADVLTRRWESYHRSRATPIEGAAVASQAAVPGEVTADPAGAPAPDAADAPAGMPSIHELEEQLSFQSLPPLDPDDRTLTVERVLPELLTCERYARADYEPIRSWARVPMEVAWAASSEAVEVRLADAGRGALEKSMQLDPDGILEISFRWDPAAFPPDARFAPELSLAAPVELAYEPTPDDEWRYDIRTVSKSERGAEETVQGLSITPLWPCSLGAARLRIGRILTGS